MGFRQAPEVLLKTVYDVLRWQMDFAADLSDGETIASIDTITISPGGGNPHLVLDSSAFSGSLVQMVFSKGVLDTAYEVVVRVVTSAGQKIEACATAKVKEC